MLTPEPEVCIVGLYPAARDGLAPAVADAGLNVADPEEPITWITRSDRRVAVVVVEHDQDWSAVEQFGESNRPVFVLSRSLASVDRAPYSRAVRYGALAAIPADIPTATIVATVRAVAAGLTVLPALVVTRTMSAAGADRRLQID